MFKYIDPYEWILQYQVFVKVKIGRCKTCRVAGLQAKTGRALMAL